VEAENSGHIEEYSHFGQEREGEDMKRFIYHLERREEMFIPYMSVSLFVEEDGVQNA
jgi:hypothetical protein